MAKIIGIDLGTTNSVVAIVEGGDPQVIVDRLVPADGVPLDTGKVRLYIDEERLNGTASQALTAVADLLRATPLTIQAQRGAPASTTTFPVEVIIGTASHVAVLSVGSSCKLAPTPDIFRAMSEQLGAGMVRVVGGFTVEKDKPKPWEGKKRSQNSED